MNIKLKIWGVGVTIFVAGIGVGKITNLVPHEKCMPKKEVEETTVKSRVKRQKPQTGVGLSRSVPSVVVARGESIFDTVPADHFEEMARTAFASPDNVENDSLLRVLISEWAKKDPESALAYAQELKRGDLVYEGLLQMGSLDADRALEWVELNADNAGEARYLSEAIYLGMAKVDPVGAVTRVEQMPAGAQREGLLSLVVNEWAKRDVYAAFDWIETAEMSPQFASIYNQVMTSYIEQDPFQAASLISEMTSGENKVISASQVACKLAEQDLDYALEWVDTLDGDAQKYALIGIVDRWAKGAEGSTVLPYVMENPDDPNYHEIFSTVVMQLAHHHPADLEEALPQMSDEDQLIAAPHLASVYSVNNPAQCEDWVQSLQPGPVQDAALKRVLQTYKYSNVPKAFDLSKNITDDSLRAEQIRQIMTEWIPVDQAAAERALNTYTALSLEEKENLLDKVYNQLKPNDYLLPANPSL